MASNIRHIVIYASCVTVGYGILLCTVPELFSFLRPLVIFDTISKVGILIIVASLEESNTQNAQTQPHMAYLCFALCILLLFFSAALPGTSYFLLKLELFFYFWNMALYKEFIVIILASVFSVLYHFRLGKIFFFENKKWYSRNNFYSLLVIILLQYIFAFYFILKI